MRLLILTPLYPPAVGGAATYMTEIVPRLAAREEVEYLLVLTEHLPGQPRRQRQGKVLLWRALPTRVGVSHSTWLGHAFSYVATQLWFWLFLPGLVRRERISLVHFHTRYRGRLFAAALRHLPVPVIADMRDRLIPPTAWAGAYDVMLACAEAIRDYALAEGVPPDRIRLIPNVFAPPPRPDASAIAATLGRLGLGNQPLALYVGDLNRNKGIYELLDAFRQPTDSLPLARLVLIGPNREGAALEAALRATPNARHLGVLPHADVLALMCAAQVLVLPSRSEGLPTVILEALAMGTRVVCPPGVPEFARWLPACVVPEITPEAISATLTRVLAAPPPTSYPVADHDPDTVVSQLMAAYDEAFKGHSAKHRALHEVP